MISIQFLRWFVLLLFVYGITVARASLPQDGEMASAIDQEVVTVKTLPLPAIPVTLRTPHERAGYLLQHFWDEMDFQDTLRSRNRDFIEQNTVNFISLWPHADTTALIPALRNLLQRAVSDATAGRLLVETVEKYVYESDSPLFDENYYLLFLEEMLSADVLDKNEKTRFDHQRRMLCMNRAGTRAKDFGYMERSGKVRTLYETKGDLLLLLFYDPECWHCEEILRELRKNTYLLQLVKAKDLEVLAIYVEGDREIWDATQGAMPGEWNVGFDIDRILERGLYYLPTMPGLYLLDRDKMVLLRNPAPSVLERFLQKRFLDCSKK